MAAGFGMTVIVTDPFITSDQAAAPAPARSTGTKCSPPPT
jgi:hypothetical protein